MEYVLKVKDANGDIHSIPPIATDTVFGKVRVVDSINNVSVLNESFSNEITTIDAANRGLRSATIYGVSSQGGVPTDNTPVAINSITSLNLITAPENNLSNQTTTSIPLGASNALRSLNNLRDKIDIDVLGNLILTQRIEMIELDGTISPNNFVLDGNGYYRASFSDIIAAGKEVDSSSEEGLCEYAPYEISPTAGTLYCYVGGVNNRSVFITTKQTTQEAFLAQLAENPCVILYPLATEKITEFETPITMPTMTVPETVITASATGITDNIYLDASWFIRDSSGIVLSPNAVLPVEGGNITGTIILNGEASSITTSSNAYNSLIRVDDDGTQENLLIGETNIDNSSSEGDTIIYAGNENRTIYAATKDAFDDGSGGTYYSLGQHPIFHDGYSPIVYSNLNPTENIVNTEEQALIWVYMPQSYQSLANPTNHPRVFLNVPENLDDFIYNIQTNTELDEPEPTEGD